MKTLSIKKNAPCCAAFLTLVLSMQGCTVNGWNTPKPSPDTSILTGSVTSGQDEAGNGIPLLDQKIIRDLVTATDKNSLAGRSLDWTNSDTGSRGVISALAEEKEHGRTCRTFQTTREAFDGVMLFSGKTCKMANDNWTITDFKAL